MHHIVEDGAECEHVAGCSSCRNGETVPFECSAKLRGEIERRAAFYGRTWDEELNHILAIAYEQREPDVDDEDMTRRLNELRRRGELPSQRRAKVEIRLASIDRLPDGVDVPRPTTVKELCDIYLEYKLKGRRSYANVRRTVRHTMEQTGFADVKLSDLTSGVIKRWHAGMASRHVTGNNGLKTLRSAYRFCRSLELLDSDPTAGIKRFREDARERYVTPSEMPRLMHALEGAPLRAQTFFLTILFTASRPGEVAGMQWKDLDFVGMRWRKPTSKTGRSQEVVLNPIVYRLLRQLPQVSDYVFPGKDLSKPWNESTQRKAWDRVRSVAKLPDVIAYDLRRTMASWMAQHGLNLSVIQQSLNHSTLQHTSRYARLDVQTAGRALDGVSKHMAASNRFFNDLCAPLTSEELSPEAQEMGTTAEQVQARHTETSSADESGTEPEDMEIPG
ncbi:MAG TPA: site-specific integrase [Nitrospira sp.]|nr:site-specific integrase [Nitrospira sp.]